MYSLVDKNLSLRINKKVSLLLNQYSERIKFYSKLNYNDEAVYAEDFFSRLLKEIKGWELRNLNRYDKNAQSIDLVSKKGTDLAIQVTSQSGNQRNKIQNTIIGFVNEYNKKGYNNLYILFIQSVNVKSFRKELDLNGLDFDLDTNIITIPKIIDEFESKSLDTRKRIYEFLNVELGGETPNQKLKIIRPVKDVVPIGFLKRIIANEEFVKNDLLGFSDYELNSLNSIFEKYNNGLQFFSILGSPCSGKSTFALKLANTFQATRVKCFYVKLTSNSGDLLPDIKILSKYARSFLIIDDIHNNYNIARKIKNRIEEEKSISVLFVSRYASTFEDNSVFFNSELYKAEFGDYKDIKDEKNHFNKFSLIIKKRISFLEGKYRKIKWVVGSYSMVYNNCNENLLSLSILLAIWEFGYKGVLPLDMIPRDDVNKQFLKAHDIVESGVRYSVLRKVASVCQFDIGYKTSKDEKQNIDLLLKYGVLQKDFAKSYICYYPHSEYAKIIYKSIVEHEGGDLKKYLLLDLKKYILSSTGDADLFQLLLKIFNSGEIYTLREIITDDQVVEKMKFIEFNDLFGSERLEFIKMLNQIGDYKNSAFLNLVQFILDSVSRAVLKLYNFYDYCIDEELAILCDRARLAEKRKYSKSNLKLEEDANKLAVDIIANRIRKRSNRKGESIKRLSALTYPEWYYKFRQEESISKIAIAFSDLEKVVEARDLAFNIYRKYPSDVMLQMLSKCRFDIVCKVLSEFSIFVDFDERTKSRYLFKCLLNSDVLYEKAIKTDLVRLSKGISDLSQVDFQMAKELFSIIPYDSWNEKIDNSEISQIEMSCNHLKKIDEWKTKELLKKIAKNKILLDKIRDVDRVIFLNRFVNICDVLKIKLSNRVLNTIREQNQELLSQCSPNELLEQIQSSKRLRVDVDLFSVFTSGYINASLKKRSLVVTDLEKVFFALNKLNPLKAKLIYDSLDSDALLYSVRDRIYNFYLIAEVLFKLYYRIDKDKMIVKKGISEFTPLLLDNLLSHSRSELVSKAKSENFTYFIKGFAHFLVVNSSSSSKHLGDVLVDYTKVKIAGITILNAVAASIKRIIDIESAYQSEFEIILIKNRSSVIQNLKRKSFFKVSTALYELSHVFPDLVSDIIIELKDDLISSVKNNKNEAIRLKTSALPQLEYSINRGGGKATFVYNELMKALI